jgi:hypothetical protein
MERILLDLFALQESILAAMIIGVSVSDTLQRFFLGTRIFQPLK